MNPSLAAPSADVPLTHAHGLAHFPIAFFSVVMGLAGLATAWGRAALVMGVPVQVSQALGLLSGLAFAAIALTYLLKLWRHRDRVIAEFRHPVRSNFFSAASLSMVLLSIALHDLMPGVAHALCIVGAAAHLAFTVLALHRWIHHPGVELSHVSPAWFIPVAGNVLVPVAGLEWLGPDVAWFYLSIGLVFWLVLLPIVMYRLFFHTPLPGRLAPTLFIMVAPPAVGTLAYLRMAGGIDGFVMLLYSAALFFTALLLPGARHLLRGPFFISGWAYSFPLAAVTTATLSMAHLRGGHLHFTLGAALLTVLTAVVITLAARTVAGLLRREICVEEG